MAESDLIPLKKELNLKKLQLDAIYEFSSALRSDSSFDDILRIYFSILMGPLGLTRAFFFDKKKSLLRKKGFPLTQAELELLTRHLKNAAPPFTCLRVEDLGDGSQRIRELLLQKQILHLVNVAENRRDSVILGLGRKFNLAELSADDEEFVFFLSRFALIALNNVHFLKQMIDKKRMEYEMSIARDIQRSLLPQDIPQTGRFEVAVIYEPIRDVGGDYYDFFTRKKNILALLLADVEGKGLSSALLAASSQAIFHTMNELYLFQPAKFVQKANSLICGLTRGQRFITLIWMLLDEENLTLTYVNAGHTTPALVSGTGVTPMSRGGMFVGFSSAAPYDQETLQLRPGDVIVAFTDGATEMQNPAGEEFGEKAIMEFVQEKRLLTASQIAEKLYKRIKSWSHKDKFKDDFTVMLIKVK